MECLCGRCFAISGGLLPYPNIGRLFGTGHSMIVDPEGSFRREFLTAYLDLDLVIMIRGHGTAGLNAIGNSCAMRSALPACQHGFATWEVLRTLGPLTPNGYRTLSTVPDTYVCLKGLLCP